MQYTVRYGKDGFGEVVFKLANFPIRGVQDIDQAMFWIAPREFPGVPPVPAFFCLNFEGENQEFAVLSLSERIFFSANFLLANC